MALGVTGRVDSFTELGRSGELVSLIAADPTAGAAAISFIRRVL
jgi:hypothetical protein